MTTEEGNVQAVCELSQLIKQLKIAESSFQVLTKATELGGFLRDSPSLINTSLQHLVKMAQNSKDGMERESGLLGIAGICQELPCAVPYVIPILPVLLASLCDKGGPVRDASELAMTNLLFNIQAPCAPLLFQYLYDGMNKKWQQKVGSLKFLAKLSLKAPEEIGLNLPEMIPNVSECMHDTKPEVSKAAISCMSQLCKVVGNPDMDPHIDLLVDCMAHPDHVSTTAEVTGPALAVMVPLLVRALNDRSAEVMRSTSIIANNLFKLVRNPADAGQFMPQILPGLNKIVDAAAFPEIRALAAEAKATLMKLAQSSTSTSPVSHQYDDVKTVREFIKSLKIKEFDEFEPTMDLISTLVTSFIQKELYELSAWKNLLSPYILYIMDQTAIDNFITTIYTHYNTIYEDDGAGEMLSNCQFSLAYGGMMLLNHTRLRLRRGQRYGLCAPNGSGKTTLLRAISLGKVEGFPPQELVRTVFVEHSLQGEDGSTKILDFLISDPRLANVSRSDISKALSEVGFDEDKQSSPVGSLSGGWKMKLELARAMLMKADVLLLDEPTNHLDVQNIAWLENYLNSQSQVTSLIVSHDSGFLDNVCTQIIHYESKKFVEKRPEAKSYYTLAATTVKFSFPPPSILLGIRSNTKAILKMNGVNFTYPGASKPSMKNVSVGISLSSRVGIVGPNGAGKSTMIKLLTGELIPQEGVVWKHPNIRIGYVAQHAFHHLEQHLEKTPNEYIQWRYQGGQDREVLEKATRKMTEDDIKQMDVEIVGNNGDKRRIEMILGRQKYKKSFQYEIKWAGYPHKFNKWIPREELLQYGFHKLVQSFDDQEASREGQQARELAPSIIRKHIEDVGLPGEIADHNAISGLSGGQKVKVVLAAAMWNNPHMLVLDEPTNYLDREALGGLAVAIREWNGAVVMISHHTEFVEALCPELWHVLDGTITQKGQSAVKEDNFEDSQAKITKMTSKPKKKKMTKNELKEQELRRRKRYLEWIENGGKFSKIPREPDTDEEVDED